MWVGGSSNWPVDGDDDESQVTHTGTNTQILEAARSSTYRAVKPFRSVRTSVARCDFLVFLDNSLTDGPSACCLVVADHMDQSVDRRHHSAGCGRA